MSEVVFMYPQMRMKMYVDEVTVHVDRYTSHVSFLMHLAHVITLTSWLKVCQVRIHSIHMSSRVSRV